jgi:hypothetical protein
VAGHCFIADSGLCHPGTAITAAEEWQLLTPKPHGVEWATPTVGFDAGDRIGMLLDLDEGSMNVYQYDRRLGVMKTGLSGEYCWAVSRWGCGFCARISHGGVPSECELCEQLQPEPEPVAPAGATAV